MGNEAIKNTAVALATGTLDQLRDAVLEAWGKSIAWLGTFWAEVDTTPVIVPGTVDQQTEVVFWAQTQLWWYTLALVIFGILVGCGRLVWEQRGKHLTDIVKQLLTFTLVTGSGVAVLQLLITGFDELAKGLLDNATKGTGFAQGVGAMIFLAGPQAGVLLVIIFGTIAILVSLVQLVMMVFRSAILILLASALPTAAAFTNTETGRQWFQRFLSWLIAFTLYKPAAALCYAVALKLTGSDIFASTDEGVKAIVGIAMMVLALAALPALMRLVTPMVAAASGGSGGAAALGAAVGNLATGAIDMARRGGGRSSSSNNTTSTNNTSKTEKQPSGATNGPSQPKASAPTGAGAAPAGAGAGAGVGASGAASAAGPAAAAAAAGVKTVKKGASAVQSAAEAAMGEGPSGSQRG